MTPESPSTNTTTAQISHADESMTSPANLPLLLTLALDQIASFSESGQQPPPGSAPTLAPPYTQHDLSAIGSGCKTPPPSYTGSGQGAIVDDSKTQPHACDRPSLSLRHAFNPNHGWDSSSLLVGAPEEAGALQLCDAHHDNDSAGRDKLSLIMEPVSIYCATTCTPASKNLNWHVNPDNDVYRWRTTEGNIPVSIDLQSFESAEQEFLVTKCFKIVLREVNDKNIGPRFLFVNDPCDSAFYITFQGDNAQCYASSFFPGSNPKDWYICVFKLALTLSSAQEQFLKRTSGEDIDTARQQAMETSLIKILAHEMLHIVGVRHCVIDLNHERESYVRFPPDLSDDDNWDPLMKPTLDCEDMYHKFAWKPQTLDEIRQIYAANEGEEIEYHRIRDVSWREGAKRRRKIAKMIARCCGPKRRKNGRS